MTRKPRSTAGGERVIVKGRLQAAKEGTKVYFLHGAEETC